MKSTPRSHSPRIRPLGYDAFADAIGCQALNGYASGLVLPFTTECLYETTSDPLFSVDPRISYYLGPADHTAPEKPFTTEWAAWVATQGIRVGQYSTITLPSSGLGYVSQLYPTSTPSKLSAAFCDDGFLAIAIQKTEATIEIRKYNSLVNPNDSIFTTSFTGFSPALINTGLAFSNESGDGIETVCYYLRDGSPRLICARFLSDGFASERILNPATRLYIGSLLGANVEQGKVVLRGLDTQGRYIKYLTRQFAFGLDGALTLSASVPEGSYTQTAFEADLDGDEATVRLAAEITAGSYSQTVYAAEDISTSPMRIGISIPRGSYKLSV